VFVVKVLLCLHLIDAGCYSAVRLNKPKIHPIKYSVQFTN